MTAAIASAIEDTHSRIEQLKVWLQTNGEKNDSQWFAAAFSDAAGYLTSLRILVGATKVAEGAAAAPNAVEELPGLPVAAEVVGQLMALSRYVQKEIFQATNDSELQELAGRFLGNLYVDVMRPLHYQYPQLVPDEMKR